MKSYEGLLIYNSFQIPNSTSNFSSWRQRPSTQKKNQHLNLPLGPPALWPHTGCVKMGSFVLSLVSFLDCAFLPLLGNCKGKTQKRQVAGENKNKWRQLSPHSPHPNHLQPPPHSSTTYPAPPPWSPWWCGGEKWPQCAPFFDFKNRNHVTASFWKIIFWKDGPPSSMVLLVFLESENCKKNPTIS